MNWGSPENRKISYKGVTQTINYQQVVNIAIVDASPDHLHCQTSTQLLGESEALVKDMAKKAGAIIAINNEPYTNHWSSGAKNFIGTGPVVRDGQVIQNSNGSGSYTLVYRDGRFVNNYIVNGNNVRGLIRDGLNYTQFFHANVVKNGEKHYSIDEKVNGITNQTIYGQISTNQYFLMCGEFVRVNDLVTISLAYNLQNAYMVNGGNCTYMYLRGVGNVTGTRASQLQGHDKVNVVAQEFYGTYGFLGLNSKGQKKLGAACPAKDIIYFK